MSCREGGRDAGRAHRRPAVQPAGRRRRPRAPGPAGTRAHAPPVPAHRGRRGASGARRRRGRGRRAPAGPARRWLVRRGRDRAGRRAAPPGDTRRQRSGIPERPRGRHPREVGAASARGRRCRRVRCRTGGDRARALGRPPRTAHRPRLGGRGRARGGSVPRPGRTTAGHQPVGGHPAHPGRGPERRTTGASAGHAAAGGHAEGRDEVEGGTSMTVLVVVLVAVLVVAAVVSLALAGRGAGTHAAAFVTVGTLAFLGLLAVVGGADAEPGGLVAQTLLVDLFLVAVLGGSPVTATVLWLVDRGSSRSDDLDRAGDVLRGGAWIGGFERVAVFASLVSGWPEGLAVM